jgi:hypothetical protein
MNIRSGLRQDRRSGTVKFFGADTQGGSSLTIRGIHFRSQGDKESGQDMIPLFRRYVEGSPVPLVPGIDIHLTQEKGPGPFGFTPLKKGPYVVFGFWDLRRRGRCVFASAEDQRTKADPAEKEN